MPTWTLLYRQNTRMALAESNQRRVFFEGQLQAVKESLIAAEMDLKNTQQKTGLVQVSSQAEAAIRSVAQTRAEIMLAKSASSVSAPGPLLKIPK